MARPLKIQSIRFKIIGSFLLIIGINAVSGYISYKNISALSLLVNSTYDQSLMSATFSQAAKFNFSQMDTNVKSALLAAKKKEFEIGRIYSIDALETLREDLDVVTERSLDKSSYSLIDSVKSNLNEIEKIKNSVLNAKEKSLDQGLNLKSSIDLFNSWENLALKKNLLRSLSAIHDSAAEKGYAFRVESDRKNKETIQRSLIILFFCLSFSLIVSLFISVLILKPLFRLRRVCLAVNEGNFDERSNLERKDEFGELASVFDFMLDTIQEKTENMSSLIASLPFGLFYVNSDGDISDEMSPVTNEIFPRFSKFSNLGEFYQDFDRDPKQVQQVLNAAFSEMMPFKSAMNLLPTELEVVDGAEGGSYRHVKLSFEPSFAQKGKLSKVIIIAEDITAEKNSQEEREKLFERVDRISKVSSNLDNFDSFATKSLEVLDLCRCAVESSLNSEQSDFKIKELKRNLHTLKGLLSLYSFNSCAAFIHSCEDFVNNSDFKQAAVQLALSLDLFRLQVSDIKELLDLEEGSETISIMKAKADFIRSQCHQISLEDLRELVGKLDHYPLSFLTRKYSRHIENVVDSLEDIDVKFLVGPSREITRQAFDKIDSSLMHLVNNSISHGIETRKARIAAGKSPFGLVSIQVNEGEVGKLSFTYRDDGRGIDGDMVLSSALKKGLLTKEQASLLEQQQKKELIFLSGFSTQEEASSIAGRGVGMDVVKNEIEALGGLIRLESKIGLYTEFKLEIPLGE